MCFQGISEPIARTKAWKTEVIDLFRDVESVSPEQRAHSWPGGGMRQERCQELDGALIIVDVGCPKELIVFLTIKGNGKGKI